LFHATVDCNRSATISRSGSKDSKSRDRQSRIDLRFYIYPTDLNWFEFLADQSGIDEVNFWQPGGKSVFAQLKPGELFLFRLKAPINKIAGGGFFVHASVYPLNAAWDAFGIKNGTSDFRRFFGTIADYKKYRPPEKMPADTPIGCIALTAPFFLPRKEWLDLPTDYSPYLVKGKSYDAARGYGKELYERVLAAIPKPPRELFERPSDILPSDMFGLPTLVKQRIGQGSFRILVTDLYGRRCSVTGERTLPVLEAAHILPVSRGGIHTPENGLLLRSDIHTLFDLGYVTIDPQNRFQVSPKLRGEWSNGKVYYDLQGSSVRLPKQGDMRPSREFLERHNDEVFRR
jgi:putative restriction endonuclease